jgi:hypothetical protein
MKINLVASKDIVEPKIKVSPPLWIILVFLLVYMCVFVGVINLPIESAVVKSIVVGVFCIVMFGIVKNQIGGNYLVTMQADKNGLYFQTDNANQYYFVPWSNIGAMEKALFPVNRRGLRLEVTGEYVEDLNSANHVGNVRTENERTFIYTIPQLQNRDKLIKKFSNLKDSSLR